MLFYLAPEMKTYRIKSPSGQWHTVTSETHYIAIQQIIQYDSGRYHSSEYFAINPHLVSGIRQRVKRDNNQKPRTL
jgi:hypothetical protein